MEEVTLYEFEASGIYILMKLYFNEQGQLIFEGLDCGETVKRAWGDFDYEYSYTIQPDQVARLYPLFGVDAPDRQALLQAIRQRFSFNEAYSRFGEFLQQHSIQFSASVWV